MDEGSRLSEIIPLMTPWLVSILLLFGAMFFAVAETSLASVSRSRLKAAAEHGDAKAAKALQITEDFDRTISTILIGTNIIHIAIASLVTVAVTRLWGLTAVSVSTIITTLVVFFAGEMLPKSIAKKYAFRFARFCAGPVDFFVKLFGPLSVVLTVIGQAAAGLTKGDGSISVTEEEIYDIIEDMTEEGSLDEEQGELISSALQFGEVTVESVLTPRVDLAAVDVEKDVSAILSYVKEQPHSRLPVYEGSIDNVIGILQIRKFIKAWLRQGAELDIRAILDEAFFVHHSTKIDELLPLMTKQRQNMAVVTDNYGGTLGIVTVEDILEELVGEIWDEEDVVEEPVVALPDGSFEIDAEESVSDAFELMGFEDPLADEELINTLMGEWAYEQFAAIPHVGDSFDYYTLHVRVAEMEHNRILKLHAAVQNTEAEEEGGEEA